MPSRRKFLQLLGAVGVAPAALTVGVQARTAEPDEVEFYDNSACRLYGLTPGTNVALVGSFPGTETGDLIFHGKVPEGADFFEVPKVERPCYLRTIHLNYKFMQLEFASFTPDELYLTQQVETCYL